MAAAQVAHFRSESTSPVAPMSSTKGTRHHHHNNSMATAGPSSTTNDTNKAGTTITTNNYEGITALMLACQQGRSEDVQKILRKKSNAVKERTRSGKVALHFCAESGSTSCFDHILAAEPFLINAQDEEGYTPLHLAVINGNKDIVRKLITAGADLNCLDNERHSLVHWATVCGEVDILEVLLSNGAPASTPDIHLAHPIHYASQMCGTVNGVGSVSRARVQSTVYGVSPKKGLQILKRLIQFGCPIDVRDQDGRQPLLWASSAGSGDAILLLVNAGAKVDAEDKDGLTALHCAASRGHTDCLETLIALCGAEVDVIDNNGCTALFYAVTLGHADCTELLLNYGAEPNRQDRKGRTPGHCGAAKGQLETLKLLSRHGGNLWLRNVRGDLPLHEAVLSRRKDLVMWLLSQRPDAINMPNNDGRCPIHLAALNNNVEMVKILIDHRADVNLLMRSGKGTAMTPLDAAMHKGNSAVAKFLQIHGGLPSNSLNDAALHRRMNRSIEGQISPASSMQGSHLGSHHHPSPEDQQRTFTSPEVFDNSLIHYSRNASYDKQGTHPVGPFIATSTPIMDDSVQTDAHYLRDMEVQVSDGFDKNDDGRKSRGTQDESVNSHRKSERRRRRRSRHDDQSETSDSSPDRSSNQLTSRASHKSSRKSRKGGGDSSRSVSQSHSSTRNSKEKTTPADEGTTSKSTSFEKDETDRKSHSRGNKKKTVTPQGSSDTLLDNTMMSEKFSELENVAVQSSETDVREEELGPPGEVKQVTKPKSVSEKKKDKEKSRSKSSSKEKPVESENDSEGKTLKQSESEEDVKKKRKSKSKASDSEKETRDSSPEKVKERSKSKSKELSPERKEKNKTPSRDEKSKLKASDSEKETRDSSPEKIKERSKSKSEELSPERKAKSKTPNRDEKSKSKERSLSAKSHRNRSGKESRDSSARSRSASASESRSPSHRKSQDEDKEKSKRRSHKSRTSSSKKAGSRSPSPTNEGRISRKGSNLRDTARTPSGKRSSVSWHDDAERKSREKSPSPEDRDRKSKSRSREPESKSRDGSKSDEDENRSKSKSKERESKSSERPDSTEKKHERSKSRSIESENKSDSDEGKTKRSDSISKFQKSESKSRDRSESAEDRRKRSKSKSQEGESKSRDRSLSAKGRETRSKSKSQEKESKSRDRSSSAKDQDTRFQPKSEESETKSRGSAKSAKDKDKLSKSKSEEVEIKSPNRSNSAEKQDRRSKSEEERPTSGGRSSVLVKDVVQRPKSKSPEIEKDEKSEKDENIETEISETISDSSLHRAEAVQQETSSEKDSESTTKEETTEIERVSSGKSDSASQKVSRKSSTSKVDNKREKSSEKEEILDEIEAGKYINLQEAARRRSESLARDPSRSRSQSLSTSRITSREHSPQKEVSLTQPKRRLPGGTKLKTGKGIRRAPATSEEREIQLQEALLASSKNLRPKGSVTGVSKGVKSTVTGRKGVKRIIGKGTTVRKSSGDQDPVSLSTVPDSGFSGLTTSASEDHRNIGSGQGKSHASIKRRVVTRRPGSGSAKRKSIFSSSPKHYRAPRVKERFDTLVVHHLTTEIGGPDGEETNSTSTRGGSVTSEETGEPRSPMRRKANLSRPRSRLTFSRGEETRLSPRPRKNTDVDTPISVTQAMQASMRKYNLERTIFQELLELKRLQIRAGKANEQLLVKRMADSYKKAGYSVNFRDYDGPYTFRNFEKYLYDQLRLLQSNRRLLPRFAPSDDLEKLSMALKKMNATKLPYLEEVERTESACDGAQCSHTTHRCHHAAHAYTGVPCAAYIGSRKNGFLPRVNPIKAPGPTQKDPITRSTLGNGSRNGLNESMNLSSAMQISISPRTDTQSPITLEVQQGANTQVFTLPTKSLDPSKNYYVSLSIKPNPTSPGPSPAPSGDSITQRPNPGDVVDDGSISAPPPPAENDHDVPIDVERDKHNRSM